MYKVFNGTFTSVLDAFSRETLVHKLGLFFPQAIATLDLEHADVVEAFNGTLTTQFHLFSSFSPSQCPPILLSLSLWGR
jgi:hypothetical protein